MATVTETLRTTSLHFTTQRDHFPALIQAMVRSGLFTEENEALVGLSQRVLDQQKTATACCWLQECIIPAARARYADNRAALEQIQVFGQRIVTLLHTVPSQEEELLQYTRELITIQQNLATMEARLEQFFIASATIVDEILVENLRALQQELLKIHTENRDALEGVERLKAQIHALATDLLAQVQQTTQVEERAGDLQHKSRAVLLKIIAQEPE